MAAVLRVNRVAGLRLAGSFVFLLTLSRMHWQWRQTSPSKHTLVVAFKGRLGNQLFQVAASEYFRRAAPDDVETAVIFRRNNYSAETDLSKSLFQSLRHVDDVDEACPGVPDRHRAIVGEVRYSCDLIKPNRLRGQCTVIDGFFQCPAYAWFGRSKVLELLKAAPEFSEAEERFKKFRAAAEENPIVALHVRRGDYTKRFNRGLLEPLPTEYYVRAARAMPARAVFMIFSDDLKWCKRELPRALENVDKGKLIFVDEKNNIVTLLLMMLADHNIIANSTFSWWAAFLNGNPKKKVCAPREWFGSRVKQEILIYPKKWMRV